MERWNTNLLFQLKELCFKIWEKDHKGSSVDSLRTDSTFENYKYFYF